MPAAVTSFRGLPAVTLSDGRCSATFLPELGMVGVSLRFAGPTREQRGEHLSLHGGIDAFAAGHTTGMPLLHPWANRLSGYRYRAGRTTVDIPRRSVHQDENGLPIHGLMVGARRWRLVSLESDDASARLVTAFDFDSASLLRAFPFPHRIEVDASVTDAGLEVTTSITSTGRRAVPVSFGWHPYFRLPGARRRDIEVHLPSRSKLVLDDSSIPTGEERREPAASLSLAGRAFDDGYRLGRRRQLAISSGARRLAVDMDAGYPYAQVFAPKGRDFVALEPMTAPTNALITGTHPTVTPGETFSATFRVAVDDTWS